MGNFFRICVMRPVASLCEASVLMIERPAASHHPNKDDIYRTPLNEKLGGTERRRFTPLPLRFSGSFCEGQTDLIIQGEEQSPTPALAIDCGFTKPFLYPSVVYFFCPPFSFLKLYMVQIKVNTYTPLFCGWNFFGWWCSGDNFQGSNLIYKKHDVSLDWNCTAYKRSTAKILDTFIICRASWYSWTPNF